MAKTTAVHVPTRGPLVLVSQVMYFVDPSREVLAETLLAAGPDSPTLCKGWLTRDIRGTDSSAQGYITRMSPLMVDGDREVAAKRVAFDPALTLALGGIAVPVERQIAILHALGMFVADLFKPRRQLEVENLFLRHQLNIALRRASCRLRLRGSDRALLVWMSRLWPSLLRSARIVQPDTILRWHRAGFRAQGAERRYRAFHLGQEE